VPSYRVTMSIGALLPGVRPELVVPSAADGVRELAVVEAADLAVVSGSARVTVRFTEDDDEHAELVGAHGVLGAQQVAEVLTWRITRRDGGVWSPVSPA
jgi:hypothetical protein